MISVESNGRNEVKKIRKDLVEEILAMDVLKEKIAILQLSAPIKAVTDILERARPTHQYNR